jgi:hypothetical protein
MKSKLSYYSLVLLVGLALLSGIVLAMNPFATPQAGAAPPAQGPTNSASSSSTSTQSSSQAPSFHGGHGDDDHDRGGWASYPPAGANVTTNSPVYSQNE